MDAKTTRHFRVKKNAYPRFGLVLDHDPFAGASVNGMNRERRRDARWLVVAMVMHIYSGT